MLDLTHIWTEKLWKMQLEKIMLQEPTLTANGFGAFWTSNFSLSSPMYQETLELQREEFATEVEQFRSACHVLSGLEKQEELNYDFNSYQLKHRVEEYLRVELDKMSIYISNGATIAAAIFCGFKYEKPDPGGVGVSINLSNTEYDKFRSGLLHQE